MSMSQTEALRLRKHLEQWLRSHELLDSSSLDVPDDPEAIDMSQGAEPTYLILSIDGSLVDLFYNRENDKLRSESDQIVADHGVWYKFHDSTMIHLMYDTQRKQHPG